MAANDRHVKEAPESVGAFDPTRLSDAELADAMGWLVEEDSREELPAHQAEANRRVQEVLGGFVSAYFHMMEVIGARNAYDFAADFINRDDLKPPPNPGGRPKKDPEGTARLLATGDTAPNRGKGAAIIDAAGIKDAAEIGAPMRRVQRADKAREARRAVFEAQRPVAEVIRDWPAIRSRMVSGKDDKT
jgi:hypothetical protein